jgi:hypothetical protein
MRKTNRKRPAVIWLRRIGGPLVPVCPACGKRVYCLTIDVWPGRKTEDRYYYHGEGRIVCKRLRSKPEAAYFIYRKKP